MADMTRGTGADSREDILDEPALASVGVDPDGVEVAPDNTPGQDDEDDEFDDDDDDAEDEENEEDEDGQSASKEEETEG